MIFYSLLAPFYIPHAALKDDLDRSGYFPSFPYPHGQDGYLRYEEDSATPALKSMLSLPSATTPLNEAPEPKSP